MTSSVWHPFTQHGLQEPVPLVTHAEGALLHTADGRAVVDAVSSWWVTTHGHSHPRIRAAIAEQAQKLDQIIFAGWTHEPAEHVAAGLRAIMPESLTRVFFSDSGSTSVEVALKMALGYWHWRGENRHRIVVMENSYHGDTIGAMSVGERGVFNQPYEPLLFDVGRIPFPSAGAEQATLDALEALCRQPDTAALIVEPLILGAGGMLVYGPETLASMQAICARHGVLFIADEVMTAWGRTGTLLACEQAGVVPDILCLSKGLTGGAVPLAVTMASEAIFEAHYSTDRARMFFHSSSYTANPIACAAAAANLAIWREEPVLDRIATLAGKQAAWIEKLGQFCHFDNPRTIGTVAALDLKTSGTSGYMSDLAPRLMAFFRERDVLLRPLGNTVYVMPPYCITDDQLGQVWEAIGEAVISF
ncbi:adenosylmethionine--8-amino-7-oxononanoate transaminase [Novosphingobium sp. TCA1]|uniref:Adenosylmethionine-8-amino-7-oxononanoate aminotransferase n=1 Tax=Novosphingobium pentaromativorans TaxID=205844 RepID=A0A2W5NMR3_9SPHN|nr:adenosylmethionine--8-amino-7-oxononanoate transaminase [Novosphingobium sp. TCA1]PZQ54706.1 MAG: adenosylmethionine--8-amino-7-oxononanoate transaminase [Novosphingobium pentaromativorans]GFE75661.1 adenosylmethionine--8-amino-7-oxononanoate aminotransferase BioA [Novosphingobium sp. TCA1]